MSGDGRLQLQTQDEGQDCGMVIMEGEEVCVGCSRGVIT